MNRNETILVYSVTGLLVVILVVAIVFGDEGPARAAGPEVARTLEELDGIAPAKPAAAEGVAPAPGELADPVGPAGPGAAEAGMGDEASEPGAALDAKPEATEPRDDLGLMTIAMLGDSRRDRDFRVVRSQPGDTFSSLVHRWCGGLEDLEVAESLNEDLDLTRLEPGTEVYLPWVDDAIVLAKYRKHLEEQKAKEAVLDEKREASQSYVVKKGDSLWKIAVRRVGSKNAAAYVKEIQALNPKLLKNPDSIREGITLLLPR